MDTSNTAVADLFIIGGGINGCGIACDAAGRGLNVVLCEQGDLASGTSSASTKLIHGGLRYLEYYQFRMVREALREREILWRKAPHVITPLQFVMPHNPQLRSGWIVRAGLFLYDHLGGRRYLPASQGISLRHNPIGQALQGHYRKAFIYSDCWVEDARLVVLNALAACDHGAKVYTHHAVKKALHKNGIWQIEVFDSRARQTKLFHAKAIINAGGPWARQIFETLLPSAKPLPLQLVKGSHLVVPALYQGAHSFLLQNDDGRVVFVIPFAKQFSLIGTTEMDFEGDPKLARMSNTEQEYLINLVNRNFRTKIAPQDIIWSYSGVRPLYGQRNEKLSGISRDYQLDLITSPDHPPLMNILGGKITTYRKLAEHALEKLAPHFEHLKPAWTSHATLPGGDIPNANLEGYILYLQDSHAWLPRDLAEHYAHSYGTLTQTLLKDCQRLEDLGQNFGAGLYAQEVNYLVEHEWATSSEDILWRRSRYGLLLSAAQVQQLDNYLANHFASLANPVKARSA